MSHFDNVLKNIDVARHSTHNCIPFPFPKLAPFLPGILPRHLYIITAGTGVGKTQFTDFSFVYNAYNFVNTAETDITLKIFYYSLELSKDIKILQGICKRLFEEYDIQIDINQLRSFSKNRLSTEVYDKIIECKEYFDRFLDTCTIHDDRLNPYGIFKEIKSYALQNGEELTDPIEIVEHNGLAKVRKTVQKFREYKPHRPKEYVIVIVDHVSLIGTQNDCPTKHDAILKLSNDMVELRNKYGYTIVMVQQQAASKEAEHFTFKGQSIISKLEPSIDGLGDNKMTSRDADVILGLFNPAKFGQTEYRGRDIAPYRDTYRNLSILKNRYGVADVNLPLQFFGAVNYFKEIE